MIHKVLRIGWLALALAACAPSASPDAVATSVAATVAAMPTATPIVALVEVTPVATAVPQASATSAPTSTPTSTPTPTATLSSDPKAALGTPTYANDFGAEAGFLPISDPVWSAGLEAGRFVMTVNQPGVYRYSLLGFSGSDVYVEVSANVGGCQADDAYGILFRVQADQQRGYYYAVSCDGRYRLYKFLSEAQPLVPVLDWTPSAAIARGPNATNVLGIFGRGNQIALYANGQLLTSVPDDSFRSGAFVGLYVRAGAAPFSVGFDNLGVWRLGE